MKLATEPLVAIGRQCGPQEAPNLGFVVDAQDCGRVLCQSLPTV